MTSRSLALIDLDNRLGEHFRPLPAASEALRRIELPGLQGNIPVGLGVRPADPRSVAAWSYSQAWTSQDGGGTWARSTFQSAATLDLAAVPTWDAKGVRVVVPLASDLAMVGDMAGGVLVPLAPPWGRTARGAYAIPASQRADGLIVAGWAPEGSSTGDGKALRVCSTRDLGRTWTEERKVGMRQWLVVDPDLPLLASSGYDGLIVSADFGRSERVLEAPGRPSFGPVWCLVGRQMWWIDRGWTRVSAYDLDSQRQRSQAIRAPGSGEEYFYYRNMAMDPRDPRRIWVSDNGFGLISSADGGLTWGMMDSGIGAATSSHIRYIDGERPYLLIGGLGCLWRIDAGPAGAALFDRPCSIIP